MRKWVRGLAWAIGIVAIAAIAVGLWKREEITRLLAVNSLFKAERIVTNFSNMDAAFLTRAVSRGNGPVTQLAVGESTALPEGTADWIADRRVTALVVLKDGMITHESYHEGTRPDDLRISWSVAKSFLSLLFGILHGEGTIPDLDAQVTDYVPSLAETAYRDASIRDVLQMESGVLFDEDYLDFNSDINRMGRVLALGGTMDGFAQSITESFATPGAQMQYTSIDTHIIGMVIRAATGQDIPSLLSERLIGPMGLEASPYYLTDGEGVAFVLGGLNLTTRDYARMGEMVRNYGRLGGQQIVPARWVYDSTRPTALTRPGAMQYGYQWWMPKDAYPGEVIAQGIYGQYVYIDRDAGVVIAVNAANRGFREAGESDGNIAMFREIARSQ
ncbi:MAG: serine hydrolase [Dinoroseobacter sp.]|nr:serine hydrolase [Dinoroseobacter sp.]